MRLIDADELKRYIHKQNGRPVIGMTFGEMIEMFIDEQPTIEPPKGEWEKFGYKWRCSCCDKRINIDGTPQENGLNFCPNCGARMKGE